MRAAGRRARAAAAVFTALAAVTAGLASIAPAQQAGAATAASMLKSFDPADIISDQVMFNPSTMSAASIQAFLNAEVPQCQSGYTCLRNFKQTTRTLSADPMCAQYKGAKNETAATIIYKVAQACGVNAQALLVTLQKEEGLVTDTWPDSDQYRKATGYACPDTTAVCDSTYNGFFNQVYKAAWAYVRYTTPKGTTGSDWTSYSWYPVGKKSAVLYNPDTSCGAKTITIKNKATASLYYYTPYLPNSAALSAGWGASNDDCSSYGNRNFYLYFTSWFGSTHYTATGSIGTLWNKLGGSTGTLGIPAGNATKVSGGSVQQFSKGYVYSSSSGTYAVTGSILTKYRKLSSQAGSLGWPTSAASTSSVHGGGTVQSFQKGAILSGTAGTFAVSGAIATAYTGAGAQGGTLSWPTADAVSDTSNGGGHLQTFATGTIYEAGTGAAYALTGAMLTAYVAANAQKGVYGWPTAAPVVSTSHGGGSYLTTQKGALYLATGEKAVGVTNTTVMTEFTARGGVDGVLSWPLSAATTTTGTAGGTIQVFTGGRIYANQTAGTHSVGGRFLTLYLRRGEATGSLGWPTANGTSLTANGGGKLQTFQSGVIYNSPSGVQSVRGAPLAAYQTAGGPAGKLGWPKSASIYDAKTKSWSQLFQHGHITWSNVGGPAKTATVTITK